MPKLVDLHDELQYRRTFGFFDDFLYFVTGDLWTDTSADTGAAVAMTDAAGGAITLTTGATDNNECYKHNTKEIFKFADDKPLIVEARLKYTEANTDDANVIFGVKDAVAADSLLDDGGGPAASYSGAVLFKVDGGTVWQAETSIAGTQTTTATTKTSGGGAYQVLTIEFKPITSTLAKVTFAIDGVAVVDSNGNPVTHQFTFTNATEMMAFVGVKAGGANSEVVTVDYVAGYQLR